MEHYGLERALFEGFSMSFLTQLNNASAKEMEALISKYLISKKYHNNESLSSLNSLSFFFPFLKLERT
jgi:midasin (ATPase involved in ribosome maturation)